MTEKIPKHSSWNLKPTFRQARRIAQFAQALGITDPIENTPTNRREARNLIFKLREQLKERNNERDKV